MKQTRTLSHFLSFLLILVGMVFLSSCWTTSSEDENRSSLLEEKLHSKTITESATPSTTKSHPENKKIVNSSGEKENKSRKQPHNFWEATFQKQQDESTIILRGQIKDIKSTLTKDEIGNKFVVSTMTLSVSEVFKGKINAGTTLPFKSYGGVVGNLVYRMSIAPLFSKGENVVVFLKGTREKLSVLYNRPASKLMVQKNELLTPSSVTLQKFREIIRRGNSKLNFPPAKDANPLIFN